jgi:hypothetical protein
MVGGRKNVIGRRRTAAITAKSSRLIAVSPLSRPDTHIGETLSLVASWRSDIP